MPATAMRQDAEQSDHDSLAALNRDYIASVQNSDVRRFDEILADDFLCSHPDGSLVDRRPFSRRRRGRWRSPGLPRMTW